MSPRSPKTEAAANSFGSLFSTDPNSSSIATLESVADWLPMKKTPSLEPQLGQP